MIELDYARLRATPVAAEPFPHVVVPDFVPPASLEAVLADLPPLGKRGSFPVDAVRLGPNAAGLMRAMEGPVLRGAIEALFGLDLHDAPTMVTLRGWTGDRDGRIHCELAGEAGDGAAVSEPSDRCLGAAGRVPAAAARAARSRGLCR